MGRPIIEVPEPHEVAELICWHCGHRWYAVYPEKTHLKNIQCPYCFKTGGAIKTGQTLDPDAPPPEYFN